MSAAAPSPARRSSVSARADYIGVGEDEVAALDDRARHDRRRGAVLRADDPGVRGQAVPDPVRVDAADAQARPADPRRPLLAPGRRRPGARRRHGLLSRRAARTRSSAATPARARSTRAAPRRASRARSRPRRTRATTFVKRVVGLPGDTIAIVNGHVIRNGKPAQRAVRLLLLGRRVQPQPDPDPGGHVLHDGRQPRQLRRQPLLGPGAAQVDHRQGGRLVLAAEAASAGCRPSRDPLMR